MAAKNREEIRHKFCPLCKDGKLDDPYAHHLQNLTWDILESMPTELIKAELATRKELGEDV